MRKPAKSDSRRKGNIVFRILKAAFAAAAVTVALILLYAWLLQMGTTTQDSIPVVNSALKAIGSVIAALIVALPKGGRRWLSGTLAGIAYILLSFAVFSIMTDKFSFSAGLLSDILMGGLAGMATGMLIQLCK